MNPDGRATQGHDRTPEDELDCFVDALIAGGEGPTGARDPDLAGRCATARLVSALREPEWPTPDFPIALAARLAAALPSGERRTPPPQGTPAPLPLIGTPTSPREPAERTDAPGRGGRGAGAWRLVAAVARRTASVAAVLVLLVVGGGALALVLPRVLRGVAVPQGTLVAAPPFTIYASDAYDGSGLVPIDPRTLVDRAAQPLLGPDVTRSRSSSMVISADRGTIAVTAYSGAGMTIRVFDARTGTERARFHPALPVIIDALSADGSQLIGRDWPPHDLNVPRRVLDATDGRLLATTPAPAPTATCCINRVLGDSAGDRTYGLLVPGADGPNSGPRVPTLVAWESRSGRELGRLSLDGMLAGFWQTDRVVDGQPVGASLDPGIALSPDGRRIAVLSAQENLLTLIDAEAMRVLWTRTVAPQGGGLDWLGLGARSAAAKGELEGARRGLVFSADGRRLYASGSSTRLDDRGEPVITPLDLLAIGADDHGGRVVATGPTRDVIAWMKASPDGAALYVCVQQEGGGQTSFVVRRLDPTTLATLAERTFPTLPQFYFLAAP